jgi:hypothetical protein
MNRVPSTTVLRETLQSFKIPNIDSLSRGDPEAIAILWEDRSLLLRLSAMEVNCKDEIHRPELESLLGDIKKTCLECTPCLRKLLISSQPRSQESIDCALNAYRSMKAFMEETCELVSPDMLSYFQVKFG